MPNSLFVVFAPAAKSGTFGLTEPTARRPQAAAGRRTAFSHKTSLAPGWRRGGERASIAAAIFAFVGEELTIA